MGLVQTWLRASPVMSGKPASGSLTSFFFKTNYLPLWLYWVFTAAWALSSSACGEQGLFSGCSAWALMVGACLVSEDRALWASVIVGTWAQ